MATAMMFNGATHCCLRSLRSQALGITSLLARAAVGGRRGVTTSSSECIELEKRFGCANYDPIPVVLAKGRGCEVWDVEGNKYLDFLAAYSAVNQGHCHPKIVKALCDQAQEIGLTSRAFHNSSLGEYAAYITEMFAYDKVLPMNTGVEGGESAIKLARKWGYEKKGVADGMAKVIFAEGNFWGRTLAAISSSTDPTSYHNFGPRMPGFLTVPYDNLEKLEEAVSDPNVVAFMVEPIQGEAGVIVPKTENYLRRAKEICKKHNVLLIADEVQSGLGRCGTILASDLDAGVHPDIVVLGKALSGGVYPISAVLADDEVMEVIRPGQHGSTYGGNPTAAKVAMAALQVLVDEKLPERAETMGETFRAGLRSICDNDSRVRDVRGRGLMNAVEIEETEKFTAWNFCMELMANGVLAKPTHGNIIRFTPPLVISESQVEQFMGAFQKALARF